MKDTTAAIPADQPQRGYFTPTDGFYGIGVWGYTRDGEHWNGWRVPYMTIHDARRIAEKINDMEKSTGGDVSSLAVVEGARPAWSETWDGQTVVHEMATLTVDGVTLYAFGGWSFTWSERHTEHRDDLARLGPLGAGEWVEIAFEALNTWHASIDTWDDMDLQLSGTLDDISDLARFVETHSPHLGDPLTYWQQADAYAIGCHWLHDYRDNYPEIWERVAVAWGAKWDAPRRYMDDLAPEVITGKGCN